MAQICELCVSSTLERLVRRSKVDARTHVKELQLSMLRLSGILIPRYSSVLLIGACLGAGEIVPEALGRVVPLVGVELLVLSGLIAPTLIYHILFVKDGVGFPGSLLVEPLGAREIAQGGAHLDVRGGLIDLLVSVARPVACRGICQSSLVSVGVYTIVAGLKRRPVLDGGGVWGECPLVSSGHQVDIHFGDQVAVPKEHK